MITDTAISNALGQRLATLTPALTIGWPNKDVPTGTPHPYLIFAHVPVSRTDSTLTGGGTIVRGFAQITIMSEIGVFSTAATTIADSIAALTLLESPVRPISEGDNFIARAGCDKRIATCGAKFANTANFRGFPNIPGQDAVLRYASQDGGHEDGVL
jgi:hypothetical protein